MTEPIRAALDAGRGIAVLALRELVDAADLDRLVRDGRDEVRLVHLHVARTVSRCGADYFPAVLPVDPDAEVLLYRRDGLGELGDLLDALRQLTGPYVGSAALGAAAARALLPSRQPSL